MASPTEYLDLLILNLKKSAKRPVHDVVCDFEEAVILSITTGRSDDSLRLIQEYSNYFHDPVPFDIRFFCTFQRSVVAWRSGDLQFAERSIKESMKIAEDNGSLQSAASVNGYGGGAPPWRGEGVPLNITLFAPRTLRRVPIFLFFPAA